MPTTMTRSLSSRLCSSVSRSLPAHASAATTSRGLECHQLRCPIATQFHENPVASECPALRFIPQRLQTSHRPSISHCEVFI